MTKRLKTQSTLSLQLALKIGGLLLFAQGCGGSGSGIAVGNPIQLSGSVAAATTTSAFTPMTTTNADKVVAIPLVNGKLNNDSISGIVETSIASDGTFNLTLDDAKDFVVLLVDSTAADKKDSVVGILSLPDSTNALSRIPTSQASSDIGVGSVTSGGSDSGLAEKTVTNVASSFKISETALSEIAKTDDIVRNAKNLYINYDKSTGVYYSAEVSHGFKNQDASLAKNAYIPASAWSWEGYIADIYTNSSALNVSSICNGSTQVGLASPTGTTFSTKWQSDISYRGTDSAGVTLGAADWATCSDGQYMGFSSGHDSGGTRMAFGTDLSIQDWNLEGFWRLFSGGEGNTLLANFDLSLASPVILDGDTNRPISYVPSFEVVTNSSNDDLITSIKIKWYVWDRTNSSFEEVTDFTQMNATISNPSLGISRYTGERLDDNITITPGTDISSSSFTHSWHYFGATDAVKPSDISISYNMAGVGFMFEVEP